MPAQRLPAQELLDCVIPACLSAERDGDVFYFQIGKDRIFEAFVSARLMITHNLFNEYVCVLADDEVKLLVTCPDREDAIKVSNLLARALVAPAKYSKHLSNN